jgi:hypothetical protein
MPDSDLQMRFGIRLFVLSRTSNLSAIHCRQQGCKFRPICIALTASSSEGSPTATRDLRF